MNELELGHGGIGLPFGEQVLHLAADEPLAAGGVGDLAQQRGGDRWRVGIVAGEELKGKGQPWELAKAFDNSAVLSDFRPLSNFEVSDIKFQLTKNGTPVQVGTTADLIFSFDTLVAYVSRFFTLQQGDLIYTGTPAGVGPVKVGDVLEGFLEGEKLLVCEIK